MEGVYAVCITNKRLSQCRHSASEKNAKHIYKTGQYTMGGKKVSNQYLQRTRVNWSTNFFQTKGANTLNVHQLVHI